MNKRGKNKPSLETRDYPMLEITNQQNSASGAHCDNGTNYEIKTYKIRWFILLVIFLINASNSINWIGYSSIADYTAMFYNVGYTSVNLLSLVFLIVSIPIGFVSVVVIDYFGIRLSLILAGWLNFIGSLLRVLSSINKANGDSLVPSSTQYAILMLGQVICALANTFGFLVTTKFANSWFKESQRALANTIALISNIFGILIGSFLATLVVNSSTSYTQQMSTYNIITCAISFVPAFLSVFVTRSTPKTPPSYSSLQAVQSQIQPKTNLRQNVLLYCRQIVTIFSSRQFLLLFITFCFAFGLFNAVLTLIQQILCIRGYTDTDIGIFGGVMIGCGIFGSFVAGILVDKTKRFEEVAKVCFCLSSASVIFFTVVQIYNNDNGLVRGLLIASFCCIGVFGLPLLPVYEIFHFCKQLLILL